MHIQGGQNCLREVQHHCNTLGRRLSNVTGASAWPSIEHQDSCLQWLQTERLLGFDSSLEGFLMHMQVESHRRARFSSLGFGWQQNFAQLVSSGAVTCVTPLRRLEALPVVPWSVSRHLREFCQELRGVTDTGVWYLEIKITCVWLFWLCVSLCTMYMPGARGGQRQCQIPWHWSYRWFWTSM